MMNFFFAKDLNGKFYFCNESFAAVAGVDSPHQIIGKTDNDLIWHKQANVFQNGDKIVLNGESFVNVEERMIQSYKLATIIVTKQKFMNKRDECIGVIGSFIDITGFRLQKKSGRYDAETGRFCLGNNFDNAYLSPKQYQIFKYILLGYSSKRIAECLHISHRTVEAYTNTIKHKLQCHSKGDIIATAICGGLTHAVEAK
jgi:DNA-binding CsgD family transcriptional regulator